MTKTLISCYYPGCPFGFADFIRASLGIHGFCVKHGYNFFIDFADDVLNRLFDIPKYTIPSNEKVYEIHDAMGGAVEGYFEQGFEQQVAKHNYYKITINRINITKELYPDLFNEILKPKQCLLDYISNLNFPKEYLAVHIRVGDNYLLKEANVDFERYFSKITQVAKDLPVIIFSDNNSVKQQFKHRFGFLIHDIPIIHTRETRNFDNFLKTIAEFYMIAFSKRVLSFNYSGFSHVSSYLYKKEYIVDYDNFHLNYLNNYIVKL
jgi:hypothetical protein